MCVLIMSLSASWLNLILLISLQHGLSEVDTLLFLLKLLYEELLERAREKEEKEAKKRQRIADDFTNLLYSLKVDEDSTNDLIHISQYLAI